MIWKKASSEKYTDFCKYIDQHVPDILEEGKNPQIENKIYNYLWLLVKAMAIKARMFQEFSDYDGYAFHAANRLYFALKRSYINQGKIIKGKEIKPIKSVLNYTKHLMYPMKVEYQNENYRMVISEEFVSKKFDAFAYKESLKDSVRNSSAVIAQFEHYIKESFYNSGMLIDRVLRKSPFSQNPIDYKRLKMTILLNSLYSLKNKKKLDSELPTVILWKLPKSMQDYVRILLREFYTSIKLEIMECYDAVKIDDTLIEKMISSPTEASTNYEE